MSVYSDFDSLSASVYQCVIAKCQFSWTKRTRSKVLAGLERVVHACCEGRQNGIGCDPVACKGFYLKCLVSIHLVGQWYPGRESVLCVGGRGKGPKP